MSTIADNMTARLAQAIKSRREQLGLPLRALASKSGVSSSMISDIERKEKSPTIATLAALAEALDVSVSALVGSRAQAKKRIHVIRGTKRPEFIDRASGVKGYNLGPHLSGSKIELRRYTVPPRSEAGPFPAHASGTIEHMHLAAGNIRVIFGDKEVRLAAGDSCSCYADTPHSFDNRDGKAEALIYLVVERP